MTVTDPTPSEHKPILRERHSNSQHGMDRIPTIHTDEVSTEKEHVYAGNLHVVRFAVILHKVHKELCITWQTQRMLHRRPSETDKDTRAQKSFLWLLASEKPVTNMLLGK